MSEKVHEQEFVASEEAQSPFEARQRILATELDGLVGYMEAALQIDVDIDIEEHHSWVVNWNSLHAAFLKAKTDNELDNLSQKIDELHNKISAAIKQR